MVLFLIATYNRPNMLRQLLWQISCFCPLPYKVIVVDDNSNCSYKAVRKFLKGSGGCFHKSGIHRGKKGYWKTVSTLLGLAKSEEFDYVVRLDDDIKLHPKALTKSLELFETVSEYRDKRVLNMLVDHRKNKKVWTQFSPKVTTINGKKIRRVGWIDGGNWVTNKRVLEILGWQCPQPEEDWWKTPGDSSGVGKHLSRELQRTAVKIYMPLLPMIYHGPHPSQMHAYKKDRPVQMNEKPW